LIVAGTLKIDLSAIDLFEKDLRDVMKKTAFHLSNNGHFRRREGESLISLIGFEQAREIAWANTRTEWQMSAISR
jgi:hypothetical protein